MKILVAVAHPNELKIIKLKIKELNLIWFNISFVQTWVGNYESIFNLTKKLENESFDFLLNIGICWYIKENNWLIQVARIRNLSTSKELIVPVCFLFVQLESIWSSEIPVKNLYEIADFDYVDMESYWVEFIANKYQIPRIILKLPSDKIWKKLDLEVIKKSCLELWNIDYISLFAQIKQFLENNLKSNNYDFIKEKYKFTFAEFEILKFKIKKYEALSKLPFSDFFAKYCELDKKDFIKLFEETLINL